MESFSNNVSAYASVPAAIHSDPIREAVATDVSDGSYHVIRRNGKVTAFDPDKINVAMTKAFLATEQGKAAASQRIHDKVRQLTQEIITSLSRRRPQGGNFHIEEIQDQVELVLMRAGEHKVARAYVLYREQHAQERVQKQQHERVPQAEILIRAADGTHIVFDEQVALKLIEGCCSGLEDVDKHLILDKTRQQLYSGMSEAELNQALLLSARMLIENEPGYSYVTARILLRQLQHEAYDFLGLAKETDLAAYFAVYIRTGIELKLLDEKLAEFDVARLAAALQAERDQQFNYLGLQTLYDRYFLHSSSQRFELPQAFFMRVAMGLALNEVEREQRAIEFYLLLSSFDFMSSTPTLFNAGTRRPQLSSCYLSTVEDDLAGIYGAIKDNALLSKYAGGLGNDWTPVRAMGAHIQGTNGKSQGVVPFLKVVNDTAVAVNQGGKRKGAVCAYLETWHLDIEEFLELRKNTGDERRRTHDMNTANWIPDLFMQRVEENAQWTLFSPDEVPDLHDKYGTAFNQAYSEYERQAEAGNIRNYKRISALTLWRKMLSMLFETGHPWLTFKDACNLRSPQRHVGVVHSSNLCTEITLNTSANEIAVCNLGSVNLAAHINDGRLDTEKLDKTITTAMRMLDNVIDINFYSVPQARNSNLRHRPVGLGLMGFQDALYQLTIPYESEQAVVFADYAMEAISYFAIRASSQLARERGIYASYAGSLWSQGVLPIDSIANIAAERDTPLQMDANESGEFDWAALRQQVQHSGMRNSNCLAIAPTATISNICGVSQSIEPTYQNLFVKSNLSGEFTISNPYLVRSLKQRHIWDEVLVNDLKYYHGSVQAIDRCPIEIKTLFKCAFEIDPSWLVKCAARRQKWLDQAQSLNLYMADASGKKLDELYRLAWRSGLKTTYYLRSKAATSTEKVTINDTVLNAVGTTPAVCAIDDPDCEACQ